MTTSLALDTFHRLVQQVDEIERVAAEVESRKPGAPSILRRSGYVLAVAALDTFFHEKVADILRAAAIQGAPHDARVASYLRNVSAAEVAGPYGASYIRLQLSFKTLVAPQRIDEAVTAGGGDPAGVWLSYCFGIGSRPDRERRQLELLYDRRNQIAHEGDWDAVQLDFREMTQSHLSDCVRIVTAVAEGFDPLL